MKALINLAYRHVVLTDDCDTVEIQFEDLDEWQSFAMSGGIYDIHFQYEPMSKFDSRKAWLEYILNVYIPDDQSKNLIEVINLDL